MTRHCPGCGQPLNTGGSCTTFWIDDRGIITNCVRNPITLVTKKVKDGQFYVSPAA